MSVWPNVVRDISAQKFERDFQVKNEDLKPKKREIAETEFQQTLYSYFGYAFLST